LAPVGVHAAAGGEQISMEPKSIGEVFEKNIEIGERLKELIRSLDPEKVDRLPDDEEWTIANVVEHISIVEESMIKICARLLGKAETEEKMAVGTINTSERFAQKTAEIATIKLEAPEFVRPTGEKSIADSMGKFEENAAKLLELKLAFEKFDSNDHRFPHPYLGDLSAGEWLLLIGGHKLRHIKQIENIAAKL
jgi:hypothetical protein